MSSSITPTSKTPRRSRCAEISRWMAETVPAQVGIVAGATVLAAGLYFCSEQMAGIQAGAIDFITGNIIIQGLDRLCPYIPQLMRPDGGNGVRNPTRSVEKREPPKRVSKLTRFLNKVRQTLKDRTTVRITERFIDHIATDEANNSYGAFLRNNPFLVMIRGPLAEEFLHRGIEFSVVSALLREELSKFSQLSPEEVTYWTSIGTILITAVIFGLAHLPNRSKAARMQALKCIGSGIILGQLRVSHGFMACCLAHITNNVLSRTRGYWDDFQQINRAQQPVLLGNRQIEPDFYTSAPDPHRIIENYFPAADTGK